MSYTDLMIDLEYLAATDNAVITQIAMIPFDIATGYYAGMETNTPTEAFNVSPHIQEQIQQGRTIDADTLSWWMNQCAINGQTPCWLDDSEESLDAALVVRLPEWSKDLFDRKIVRVWSNARGDLPKLYHAYENLQRDYRADVPWLQKNAWDRSTVVRTAQMRAKLTGSLGMLAKVDRMKEFHDDKSHDALWDCVCQINEITLAWEILNYAA